MQPAPINAVSKDGTNTPTALNYIFRIGRLVAWMTALNASLLAFPNVLPLVPGFWLLLFSIKLATQPRSEFPRVRTGPAIILVLILALVLIKWPRPSSGLILFCSGVAGLLILVLVSRRHPAVPISATLAIVWLLWGAYVFFHLSEAMISRPVIVDPERPVVCLGDSLTDYGYPEVLAGKIKLPVEDFGFNGYTTDDVRRSCGKSMKTMYAKCLACYHSNAVFSPTRMQFPSANSRNPLDCICSFHRSVYRSGWFRISVFPRGTQRAMRQQRQRQKMKHRLRNNPLRPMR